MFILVNNENIIVGIVDDAIRDENGLLTYSNGHPCYYPPELTEVEVLEIPSGIKPFTHKYVNGNIIVNPDYVAPPKTQVELEQEIETLKLMVADLGLMVGGGL